MTLPFLTFLLSLILKKPDESDFPGPTSRGLAGVISTFAIGSCFLVSASWTVTAPMMVQGLRRLRWTRTPAYARTATKAMMVQSVRLVCVFMRLQVVYEILGVNGRSVAGRVHGMGAGGLVAYARLKPRSIEIFSCDQLSRDHLSWWQRRDDC